MTLTGSISSRTRMEVMSVTREDFNSSVSSGSVRAKIYLRKNISSSIACINIPFKIRPYAVGLPAFLITYCPKKDSIFSDSPLVENHDTMTKAMNGYGGSTMSELNSWVHEIFQQYDIDFENKKLTAKQRSILEAAILLFAAKGYNGTTTNEIAKQAGVAEATIFKHYRSKKGLLLRLVIPAIAKFASPFILHSMVKILEQDKPMEKILEELIRDRAELVEKNWDTIRIVIVESLFHPELREALQEQVAKRIFQVVSEKVDQLKERGKIRTDLPNHVLLRSMMSLVFGYLFGKNIAPSILAQGEEQEELKWTVEMMLYGLVGNTHKV